MITIIQAIARMEGWGKSGDIPTRDNNPGDIDAGVFASSQQGFVGNAGRFARFDNAEDGFNALRNLLTMHYLGMTIESAMNKYAPPVENQTNNYITVVCELTGNTPDTVLTAENIG